MLVVYLANSGGRVEIPHAVECVDTGDSDYVSFLDANGMCLVRFCRADVSIYAPPEQAVRVDELLATSGNSSGPSGKGDSLTS